MRKVSFGGRTVYNLARKQRRPSELHGNGMALLLQTFVFTGFFLHSLSIFVSLLFPHLVIQMAPNQPSHSTRGPGASVCLADRQIIFCLYCRRERD